MAGSCFRQCVPIDGTVYGVALDGDDPLGTHSELFSRPPYNVAPTTPVLFIKPRNTFLAHNGIVQLPRTLLEVEASAALAVVFARDTRGVAAAQALSAVAGYTLAIDLAEPGADFFRPPIRETCRDGFLPVGPVIVSRDAINIGSNLLRLEIDGREAASLSLESSDERIAKLIEEVSAYMTFSAGDVLLATRTPLRPRARNGSRISAILDGVGRLDCCLGPEEEVMR
jgi:5-oxopent-3-ene-1,2,5-tricarboxylate decarboxylase / 2-hydroxyhepta-2,4-diene-1,7-dioate isomerase